MTVPKLTSDNFDEFDLALQGAARKKVGLYGILLDYHLRPNDTDNYDELWNLREEKLKICVIFVGQSYKDDSGSLYTLLGSLDLF